jgi:hypothetical protein
MKEAAVFAMQMPQFDLTEDEIEQVRGLYVWIRVYDTSREMSG